MSTALVYASAPVIARSDAYEDFITVIERYIPIPNYLDVRRICAPDFRLYMPNLPGVDIDGAIEVMREYRTLFTDLGRRHHVTDVVFADEGRRMACVDTEHVTLGKPISLPNGTIIDPTMDLTATHRVTTNSNGLITEWIIAQDISSSELIEL